ncbi:hypothetical protein BJY59DRAFT_584830 [Rhodotorula toruloides]
MTLSDRTVGGVGLLCSISFFLYYTLWTLLSVRRLRRCLEGDALLTLLCSHASLSCPSYVLPCFPAIRNGSSQPFLPPSSPLLILFPLSREWAIRLPALILLFGLCFVGMVTGFVLIETARKKERARRLKMVAGRHSAGGMRRKGD